MNHPKTAVLTAALALATMAASAANAGDARGNPETITKATAFQPIFQDGKLRGCEYDFDAYQQEYRSFSGDWIELSGGIVLMRYQGKAPAVMEKLAIGHMAKPNGSFDWVRPAELGLQDGLQTNRAEQISVQPGETPGSLIVISTLGSATSKLLLTGIGSDRLSGYFALPPGDSSINFDIDLRVADEASKGTDAGRMAALNELTNFTKCLSTVVDTAN
jgi:hypothetical protein